MAVYFTGPPINPSVVMIASALDDQGEVVMAGTSITAATVRLTGAGRVAGQGTNVLTSPAIEDDASEPGGIAVLDGTLTLAGTQSWTSRIPDLSDVAGAGDLTPAGTLTMEAGSSLSTRHGALSAQRVTVSHDAMPPAGGSITGNVVNGGVVEAADPLVVSGGYSRGPDGVLGAGFGQELQVTGRLRWPASSCLPCRLVSRPARGPRPWRSRPQPAPSPATTLTSGWSRR
jgi:hypothetical protein